MSLYGYYIQEAYIEEFNLFKKKKKEDNDPKTLYYVCYKELAKGSKDINGLSKKDTSAKHSLMFTIAAIVDGYIDEDKVVVLSRYKKKYEEYLEMNIFIYSVENITYDDYGAVTKGYISSLVYSGIVKDAISHYNIKVSIENTSKIETERKSIYTSLMKYGKQALNTLFEEHKEYKKGGFELVNNKDSYEEFITGIDNSLPVIGCDAWEFTNNKARDDEEYKVYNDALIVIEKILKDLINKDNKLNSIGYIEYTGDWDSGSIDFIIKK